MKHGAQIIQRRLTDVLHARGLRWEKCDDIITFPLSLRTGTYTVSLQSLEEAGVLLRVHALTYARGSHTELLTQAVNELNLRYLPVGRLCIDVSDGEILYEFGHPEWLGPVTSGRLDAILDRIFSLVDGTVAILQRLRWSPNYLDTRSLPRRYPSQHHRRITDLAREISEVLSGDRPEESSA